MSKMKTLLVSLALRPLTKLKPKIRNKTRWSSTFEMVTRYFRFKDDLILAKLEQDVAGIEDFMLSPNEERKLKDLQKLLDPLHQVTLQLQNPSMTFGQLRVLFDYVMQEYPTMNLYIASDSAIIHSPHFETALVKISSRQEHTLTQEERVCVEKLKRLNAPVVVIDVEMDKSIDSFVKKAFETLKTQTYEFSACFSFF